MTHNENIQDLLYFKGKRDDLTIVLESSKMIENSDNYSIILSIAR